METTYFEIFLLISLKITTFLLLLSSNIGKVAELWTLGEGEGPREGGVSRSSIVAALSLLLSFYIFQCPLPEAKLLTLLRSNVQQCPGYNNNFTAQKNRQINTMAKTCGRGCNRPPGMPDLTQGLEISANGSENVTIYQAK